jgi:hypothetical protein
LPVAVKKYMEDGEKANHPHTQYGFLPMRCQELQKRGRKEVGMEMKPAFERGKWRTV